MSVLIQSAAMRAEEQVTRNASSRTHGQVALGEQSSAWPALPSGGPERNWHRNLESSGGGFPGTTMKVVDQEDQG